MYYGMRHEDHKITGDNEIRKLSYYLHEYKYPHPVSH